MENFPCGHARRSDNLTSAGRCRSCKNRMVRDRYWRERGQQLAVPQTTIEDGSYALLRALFREHPYVFDAAERSGRLVQRP